METLSINDKGRKEICDSVGKMLVEKLDTKEIWNRVERIVAEYIRDNKLNLDASDLTKRLEWSVNVQLKK
jgi:hypothetical protein